MTHRPTPYNVGTVGYTGDLRCRITRVLDHTYVVKAYDTAWLDYMSVPHANFQPATRTRGGVGSGLGGVPDPLEEEVLEEGNTDVPY